MKRTIKIYIALLLLLSGSWVSAQQDAIFSQYMFNPFAINPAYAGSRNALSGVLLYRNQWAGMSGAPKTGTLAVHSPIKGRRFALGMSVYGEQIGPNTNSGFSASYAYHLKVLKGKLAFGLRGGLYNTAINRDVLSYNNDSDIHNTGGYVSANTPNFDFGSYYYTSRFYLGLSISHLTGQKINYKGDDQIANGGLNGGGAQAENSLKRHVMLATGYAFAKNPNFVIKPSILVKAVEGAPLNIDINTSFLFNKVFWLGASYRSSGSIILITEYNITDFLRIGYSYDFILGTLRKYNSGSHEVFIGVDLARKSKNTISPRYM